MKGRLSEYTSRGLREQKTLKRCGAQSDICSINDRFRLRIFFFALFFSKISQTASQSYCSWPSVRTRDGSKGPLWAFGFPSLPFHQVFLSSKHSSASLTLDEERSSTGIIFGLYHKHHEELLAWKILLLHKTQQLVIARKGSKTGESPWWWGWEQEKRKEKKSEVHPRPLIS